MTVSEAKLELITRFQIAGIDSPEANADWLLTSLLDYSRAELLLRLDQIISDEQLEILNSQAYQRTKRKPLQHILGTACFCGLDFHVSPEVLIPRPETEQLVELAADAVKTIPCPIIYDFGTGSGCIAISLAKRLAKVNIIASDISTAALRLAKSNAKRHDVANRIEFRQADGPALSKKERVHLIVSNPPYIPSAEIVELQPEVRDFDPLLALDGGSDGLEFYRSLAAFGQASLFLGSSLIAEFGDGQEKEIDSIFRNAAWQSVNFEKDLCGKPRMVIASTGL